LIAGEDAVRTRGQVIEQTKFERAERNGLAGMADAVGRAAIFSTCSSRCCRRWQS
jgi:hypothetical protein